MGSKWKPRQLEDIKPRSKVARAMIEGGTGKGRPMRDRRVRRRKERDGIRELQEEEEFYDEQDHDR